VGSQGGRDTDQRCDGVKDGIRLKLTKEDVASLPAVVINHAGDPVVAGPVG
jgi:hypothetical protein